MADVGSASLQIIPSFKGFGTELERGTSPFIDSAGRSTGTKFGESAGRSAGSRFGSVFRTAAKASLVGVAALGVGAFKLAKDSVGLASDLNESLNAVNISYGKQAGAVKKLGREAADALGLSNTEFNSLSVRFSAFSKTIAGGPGRKVVSTLDSLTTRAADFASVMNLEVNEAAQLFQSGLAGETEPLRKFGIDLSAAAVEAHGLKMGMDIASEGMTEAQKVQARYSLLMKSTSKAAGDFANTSDSLANRQRILNARWDDARAKLGTALLPMMEDAAGFLLDKGIPAFEDFSDWFVDKGIPAIQDFADDVKPLVESALPAMGDALGIARDALKDAAPFAKDLVDAFNDMPDWAKTAIVGGTGAAVLGKKLGAFSLLGRLGKSGGGLVSKAAPVPVFVTNPGFGGAGGDVPGGKSKLSKLGRAGGVAAGVAGVGFLAEPILTGNMDSINRGVAGGGVLGGIGPSIRQASEAVDGLTGAIDVSRDSLTKFERDVLGMKQPLDNAGFSARVMKEEVYGLGDAARDLPARAETRVSAPGLSGLLGATREYKWYLDGLDNRTITTHFETVTTKVEHTLRRFAPARASGGHVGGGTYLVGERGPELLSMNGTSGRVIPNHALRGRGGGSQRVVLDFGAGRTLTGWIQDEIADAEAFAGTRGRMR